MESYEFVVHHFGSKGWREVKTYFEVPKAFEFEFTHMLRYSEMVMVVGHSMYELRKKK